MPRLIPLWSLAALFVLSLGWHTPGFAQSGAVLQVTPSDLNAEQIDLTLADLDAMEQVSFRTTTIWTDDEVTFSGVSLKSLLDKVAADGTALEMVALNDYKVDMPLTVLEDGAPIIATRMNGETMSVRDKGPFWVVFPYDADPKYQTETIYAYSIWQLNRLKVVD